MRVFKDGVHGISLSAMLGVLLAACVLGGCSEPVRQRKNVKDLTPEERRDYVNAVLKLKSTPSPLDSHYSWYDQFVALHKQVYYYRPADAGDQEYQIGHNSPSFLPWHRKLLLMYEDALREVSGKDITLPYWDWTDPASTRAVFTEDFMGLDGVKDEGYAVRSGPFRKEVWQLNVLPKYDAETQVVPAGYLVRHIGVSLTEDGTEAEVALPTAADMEECLEIGAYDLAPWNEKADRRGSFRNCVEGWAGGDKAPSNHMHNSAHVWVGGQFKDESGKTGSGSMAAVDTSPNDPVFFLHHANVDRIWALWQQRHGDDAYAPDSGGNTGWNREDSLYPFNQYLSDPWVTANGLTPADMLDTRELGYEYR